MKAAGWQPSTTPEVGPPADIYEDESVDAKKSEIPDWLKVKASEEFIVNSSVSDALNGMLSDSEAPLGVNGSGFEKNEDSTQSNDKQSVNSEVTMSDDNSPEIDPKDENSDWMAQFFDESKNNPNELNSEKDLPDWLNNLGQDEISDTKPDEPLPDWLNTLDADIVEQKDETKEPSIDLDAILSDLANQPEDNVSIPFESTEEDQSDVPALDAEDISLRLEGLTQPTSPLPTYETPEVKTPESAFDQQFAKVEEAENFYSPAAELEEDDSQIPDWVKTVLTGPEVSDTPYVDAESTVVNNENLVHESPITPVENEIVGEDFEGNEGAISAATSEELLGWLREISPEQGISDESNEIGDISQNEFESTVYEPVDDALNRLTNNSTEPVAEDLSVDTPSEIPSEEIISEPISFVQDDEEILPEPTPSADQEPIAESVTSPGSSITAPSDFATEMASTSIPATDEIVPELNENVPDGSNLLVELIKNNQYDDAIRQLSLTSLENDNGDILDIIQKLKPERESDFDFMQFLGDVYAKSNRFDEALEAYTCAEELLTQTQE